MKEGNQNLWESLINKYVSIWLWSIFFGATATVTYQLSNSFYRSNDWGSLSIAFIAILLYGVLFAYLAWSSLYQYLIKYILPKFFPTSNSENFEESELNVHSDYLRKTFKYVMFSASIVIFLRIAEMVMGVIVSIYPNIR